MEQARKRNAQNTKDRLLEAAQTAFAANGYAGTGIRDIAALAGVNSSLLVRYFGSKAAIFEAALAASINLEQVTQGERQAFAGRLGDLLFEEEVHLPGLAFSASAGRAPDGEIVSRVIEKHAVAPLARWLGPPDERSRALKIIVLAAAIHQFHRHNALGSGGGVDNSSMREWFVASVQSIVDGAGTQTQQRL